MENILRNLLFARKVLRNRSSLHFSWTSLSQFQSEPRPVKDVLSCTVLAEGSTKFYIEYADRTIHTYDSHADMDVTSMPEYVLRSLCRGDCWKDKFFNEGEIISDVGSFYLEISSVDLKSFTMMQRPEKLLIRNLSKKLERGSCEFSPKSDDALSCKLCCWCLGVLYWYKFNRTNLTFRQSTGPDTLIGKNWPALNYSSIYAYKPL